MTEWEMNPKLAVKRLAGNVCVLVQREWNNLLFDLKEDARHCIAKFLASSKCYFHGVDDALLIAGLPERLLGWDRVESPKSVTEGYPDTGGELENRSKHASLYCDSIISPFSAIT
jgi:hypothetical protein